MNIFSRLRFFSSHHSRTHKNYGRPQWNNITDFAISLSSPRNADQSQKKSSYSDFSDSRRDEIGQIVIAYISPTLICMAL